MERQAYYFARIEVAVEGLRAGVKHPALHELLDIVDEARYCLEEELTPLSDKSDKSDSTLLAVPSTEEPRGGAESGGAPKSTRSPAEPGPEARGRRAATSGVKRRGRPARTAGPYSAAGKEQERARRALIADLQEVIDRAGCTNIPDAVAELLQCDVQPGVIFRLLDCTFAEFAALRDGKTDAGLAGKFLAVFKLKSEKEV